MQLLQQGVCQRITRPSAWTQLSVLSAWYRAQVPRPQCVGLGARRSAKHLELRTRHDASIQTPYPGHVDRACERRIQSTFSESGYRQRTESWALSTKCDERRRRTGYLAWFASSV